MKDKAYKNNSEKVELAVISTKVDYISQAVGEIKHQLESEYITKAEFAPIQKIVYGMVGLILVGVIGALITLVLRK